VLTLAAGILLGWWNTRPTQTPRGSNVAAQPPAEAVPASTETISQKAVSEPALGVTSLPSPKSSLSTVAPEPDRITNWTERLEAVLSAPLEDHQKVGTLLQILPQLPQEGQSEVAAVMAPLVPDSEFAELGQYLTNSSIAPPVMDVLMAGLLDRPNPIKLPWLLEIARNGDNPRAPDALNLLQVFLDENNGDNWQLWQTSVDRFLQSNPR